MNCYRGSILEQFWQAMMGKDNEWVNVSRWERPADIYLNYEIIPYPLRGSVRYSSYTTGKF